MTLRILHTNDFHGALRGAALERLMALREQADLYFDTGDLIKAGNLAVPVRPDPGWAALAQLRCDASVLGNRETHVMTAAFQAKLAGAKQPVLCGNLRTRSGERPLPGSLVIEAAGMKVGVVAAMVPMVTERMASQALSAYLWDPPIETIVALAGPLRSKVDCLIALTHVGIAQDRKLAQACPELDLILGGHSHTVLETPERVGQVAIAQGGSHARYAGMYTWAPGEGLVAARLEPLPR